MAEDLVKRLRDPMADVSPEEAADEIEKLRRSCDSVSKTASDTAARLSAAEQALAAALKRLETVAEIAVEPYDASARASQAVQYAYLLSRIATIAKELTNG